MAARRKKYAEDHVEEERARSARYVAENPEKVRLANRESQRRTREERPQLYLWRKAKERAVRFGLAFDIEPEDLVIPDLCPYLGIPLGSCPGLACDGSPSVDRIDSTGGYTKTNVRIVSRLANTMKNKATVDQLQTFALNVLGIHGSGDLMGDFIGEIDSVGCPRCSHAGPHDRAGTGTGGAFVIAACRECELEWRVAG